MNPTTDPLRLLVDRAFALAIEVEGGCNMVSRHTMTAALREVLATDPCAHHPYAPHSLEYVCAECASVKAGPTEADSGTRNWHSIIGPNGLCECGVDADGRVVTCGQLFEIHTREQARAVLGLERCAHHPDAEHRVEVICAACQHEQMAEQDRDGSLETVFLIERRAREGDPFPAVAWYWTGLVHDAGDGDVNHNPWAVMRFPLRAYAEVVLQQRQRAGQLTGFVVVEHGFVRGAADAPPSSDARPTDSFVELRERPMSEHANRTKEFVDDSEG